MKIKAAAASANQIPNFHKAVGKDIRRVALRILILYKLAHCRTNYYSLVKDIQKMQLERAKAHMSAGSTSAWTDRITAASPSAIKSEIYNIVSALEKSEYITAVKRKSGDRTMKYYRITPSGVKILKETQDVLTRTVKDISKIVGE
ncbi:MAG: PadR family transcriptional regulator [Candidatus Marsarchaeota archaeon]|nr:PadR family transcriptional regulator [Candidatus Marsarchaeota archaeon]